MIATVGETLPPPASSGFLGEIEGIEQQTPLPPLPPDAPD